MSDEIISLLITLSSKKNDKKSSHFGNWKNGLDKFEDDIKPIIEHVIGLVQNFEFMADLLINFKEF